MKYILSINTHFTKSLACLSLLIPLLTGCLPSSSKKPVGSLPLPLVEQEWVGTWVADGSENYYLRLKDADAGQLRMAWLDSDRNKLTLNNATLLLRRQGDAILFNLKPEGDPSDPDANGSEFQFGRLVKEGNHIVAWSVRPESLRTLAELSVIKAEFETNHNRVMATVISGQESLARRLAAEDGWLLLDLEHPLVFVRQGSTAK